MQAFKWVYSRVLFYIPSDYIRRQAIIPFIIVTTTSIEYKVSSPPELSYSGTAGISQLYTQSRVWKNELVALLINYK